MAGVLFTADGPVMINRDQINVPQLEMKRMADFHEVAQKYNWTVTCRSCGGAITGQNNNSQGGVYVVRCKCTEFICDTNVKRGR